MVESDHFGRLLSNLLGVDGGTSSRARVRALVRRAGCQATSGQSHRRPGDPVGPAALKNQLWEATASGMSERKPTIGYVMMVAAAVALVYLLSFGPAMWLVDR